MNQARPQRMKILRTWVTMFDLLGQLRLEYIWLTIAGSLLSGIEGVVHPILIRTIFDDVVKKRDLASLMVWVMSYLALGLFTNVATARVSVWSKSLEVRLVKSVNPRLLRAYYEGEYRSVIENGHGYFVNRLFGDVSDGLGPFLLLIQSMLNQVVLLVSLSMVLAYLSWKAFLCLAALIPVSAVVGVLLGKRIKALALLEREREAVVLAYLTRALNAFRIVRTFTLLPLIVRGFDDQIGGYLSTMYQRYKTARTFQALNDLMMLIADVLSMTVGAVFVLRGALTFGGYLAFVNAFWRAVTTLMQLFKQIPEFNNLSVIVMRIGSFLSFAPNVYYLQGAAPAVNHIRVAYRDRVVFTDFSLDILSGERVVIVGPNGSGKTTLAHILSGYLAPAAGEVVLPPNISAVTLPIIFPPLRVRDMVENGQLLAALGLEDGGVLEAFADELSVGQQQRVAIALLLSQDADLYIIDEPIANLDSESRGPVMNLIVQWTKGKTLIVVMHGSEEYYKLFDRVVGIHRRGDESPVSFTAGEFCNP